MGSQCLDTREGLTSVRPRTCLKLLRFSVLVLTLGLRSRSDVTVETLVLVLVRVAVLTHVVQGRLLLVTDGVVSTDILSLRGYGIRLRLPVLPVGRYTGRRLRLGWGAIVLHVPGACSADVLVSVQVCQRVTEDVLFHLLHPSGVLDAP